MGETFLNENIWLIKSKRTESLSVNKGKVTGKN